jgi:hypothetical protein
VLRCRSNEHCTVLDAERLALSNTAKTSEVRRGVKVR